MVAAKVYGQTHTLLLYLILIVLPYLVNQDGGPWALVMFHRRSA